MTQAEAAAPQPPPVPRCRIASSPACIMAMCCRHRRPVRAMRRRGGAGRCTIARRRDESSSYPLPVQVGSNFSALHASARHACTVPVLREDTYSWCLALSRCFVPRLSSLVLLVYLVPSSHPSPFAVAVSRASCSLGPPAHHAHPRLPQRDSRAHSQGGRQTSNRRWAPLHLRHRTVQPCRSICARPCAGTHASLGWNGQSSPRLLAMARMDSELCPAPHPHPSHLRRRPLDRAPPA